MRHRQLDRVLRNIVSLTLAGSAGAAALGAAACGTDGGQAPIGQDMTPACPLGPLVQGFNVTPPVDYIAERSEFLPLNAPAPVDGGASTDGGTPSDGWRATIGQARGTPCATATDPSCTKRLAELRIASATGCPSSQEGFDRTVGQSTIVGGTGAVSGGAAGRAEAGCSVQYLVYTRGDEIGVARTRAEIVALLGAIDTKEEALYLAAREGVSFQCNQDPKARFRETPDGFEVLGESYAGCTYDPVQIDQVLVKIAKDGTRTVVSRAPLRQSQGGCVEGRRPHGLASDGSSARCLEELGAYFARSAHLEAASVVAFEQLECELRALGAPERILRAMRRARREEIAHARVTTELARRFGAEPAKVRVRARTGARGAGGAAPSRSALAIALENAREGCVRETLGAAIALYRAEVAADPAIARAYRKIAADEIRHAQLSWDLAAWLDSRLSPSERGRVRRAFAREIAALRADLDGEPSPLVAELAGAPTVAGVRALLGRLERDVWSEAAPFAA